jgi:hypothetical protein
VNHGSNVTFSFTPNAGYHIAAVLVDGVSQGAITDYTFSNVAANHTIAVSFAINRYTLTPSTGAHGSISPATPQTVNHGSSVTFNITPDTGYHIADVLIDGVSQGAIISYTFSNVTANHTIVASFAIDTYTLMPSAGANGTISPDTPQIINYGTSKTFNVHQARAIMLPMFWWTASHKGRSAATPSTAWWLITPSRSRLPSTPTPLRLRPERMAASHPTHRRS